jgi:LmbE family N-acetylglucosaminyl deacetylase
MQFEHLDQLNYSYEHIYLSPHLDDAALSCGGAILAQRAAGERVLVVTLCTAAPPADADFSPLAREFHQYWDLAPAEVVKARLREERLAMEQLGADSLWAGMLDAIYRHPTIYNSRDRLFGTADDHDPLLPQVRSFLHALHERMPQACYYAPLGIGQHVDHQIAHRAAADVFGDSLHYYEDFPYVIKPGALERRIASLHARYQPHIRTIDPVLPAKIKAIDAYASQLAELFGSSEAMAPAVAAYAHSLAPEVGMYGERVWVRVSLPPQHI